MKFTQIPPDTFRSIQLNAGVLLSAFTPATATLTASSILGATSGGISFTAAPTYSDWGEDIDNCPKNTKELKKLDSWEAKMSGTFVTVTASLAKMLVGAGAADASDASKIVPRNDLDQADFSDLWWVGDYSQVNADGEGAKAAKAGMVAIHLMNGLSTGGFQIRSGDKSKGQFAFEFTGHYSIEAQDTVPFEIYVKAGTEATA